MTLDAAPFQSWVRRMAAQYGTLDALNERVGHDLSKHARGTYKTVQLGVVDGVLAAEGSTHLSDIYPELYDGEDEPLPKTRGGWKRPDRWGLYSKPQLRLLYKLHLEQNQSINSLAKRTYEKLGYASHNSAAKAISTGWKRMGLQARDRIEMCRIASTIHGRAPKHGPRVGYKTFLRNQRNIPYQPFCRGFKSNPPRQGSPCHARAMVGADYCQAHDPLRALENQARCARMRRRRPRPEMLPMGPFALWLESLALERGSLRAACEYHGLRYDSASRYRKCEGTNGRPKDLISRQTVEAWLESVGADLSDLYGIEAAA